MNGICYRFIGVVIFLVPGLAGAQSPSSSPDNYQPMLERLQSITTIPLASWYMHDANLSHGENPGLDTSAWEQIKVDQPWEGSRWLVHRFEVPEQVHGYGVEGSAISLDLRVGSEHAIGISVFANGSMVARTDADMQIPIMLTEHARPGETFVLAVRIIDSGGGGCCGGDATRVERAEMRIQPAPGRPDPVLLRLEILSAKMLISAYPNGQAERQQQLDAVAKAINLAALDQRNQASFDASLRTAQSKLEALRPYMQQFAVEAVGNSHIDMAWLWPWTETVEVIRDTFGTALELMREYPEFKFTASTAQAYEWIEEKYPAMFQEIQQRVKEGRWEVIGGMWVEPDLNMPDGESLVRQILYGKRYFQQKFGININIGWNPDSFGYNWQLPQIYKRSGIDYFVTQKLLWASEFTKFPYRLFWWQAPDGSRVLTYFPSEYANPIDPVKMARDAATYGAMLWKWDGGTNSAPQASLEMMYLYGVGDHGGGPTRQDLDTAVRWQQGGVVYPQIKFSTADQYFADLQKNGNELRIPTWDGELYFQYHRGVQTTQAEEKKGNRKNEVLILEAEKLAAIATMFGAAYPQQELDDAWKKILFNQFHDILPGSGIHINYVDAARKYADTERVNRDIIQGAMQDLASSVNSPGVSVLVFNPLSWTRTDEVEVEAQFPAPVSEIGVIDVDGKQLLAESVSMDAQTNRVRMRILAQDVPAMGYKLIRLEPMPKLASNSPQPPLAATSNSLENDFIRLVVDPKSGCITSLFDKRSHAETLASPVQSEGSPAASPDGLPCGNLLQAFVDKPAKWDAWNIDADFVKQHWDLMQADAVELREHTPLRAVIRVRHHFQNSSFVQDITMYAGVPRVDVRMQADWHEKHILLKVAFPVSARNDKATFEIPYGTVQRPTTRRIPEEQAQFEVPALRWADLSDASHGFSLLNDSKYGYDAKDNVLRLSLLRSPTFPDPEADQGMHEFTYSLYPHSGTWKESMTIQQGYELNYPLLAVATTQHAGVLPAMRSFFAPAENNVVITAVKKSVDDNSVIIRYYEWAGSKGTIHIKLPQPATGAWEVNLMETGPIPLALDSTRGLVAVPTDPYEIKTIKVQWTQPQNAQR
jgi:alpha-mannosidase